MNPASQFRHRPVCGWQAPPWRQWRGHGWVQFSPYSPRGHGCLQWVPFQPGSQARQAPSVGEQGSWFLQWPQLQGQERKGAGGEWAPWQSSTQLLSSSLSLSGWAKGTPGVTGSSPVGTLRSIGSLRAGLCAGGAPVASITGAASILRGAQAMHTLAKVLAGRPPPPCHALASPGLLGARRSVAAAERGTSPAPPSLMAEAAAGGWVTAGAQEIALALPPTVRGPPAWITPAAACDWVAVASLPTQAGRLAERPPPAQVAAALSAGWVAPAMGVAAAVLLAVWAPELLRAP